MHTHHFYIGFIIMVLAGAGIFYILNNGLYPVAFVNGNAISADEFERVATAALRFYIKSQEAARHRMLTPEEVDVLYEEIRRGTLDKLIGDRLVDAELAARFGTRAHDLAEEKIAAISSEKLRAAATGLYEMAYEEFRDTLLLPEAKQELLGEAIKSEAMNVGEWLMAARSRARVAIFMPHLIWQNGGVEIAR